MHSAQRTRQPLSEIVVDPKKAIKRPLSPSTILLSPSKRRVLAVEGISTSPRRVPKGTLFQEFLIPPLPSNKKSLTNQTPVPLPSKQTSQSSTILSPSPDIAAFSQRGASNPVEMRPHPSDSGNSMLRIPREIPPISDRQSIHWPGFDVHCDTHITIPTSSSKSLEQAPLSDGESDSERSKENVKPRRVASKRRDSLDVNPFKDDRPSPKVFSPSSVYSVVQARDEDEATVEQQL